MKTSRWFTLALCLGLVAFAATLAGFSRPAARADSTPRIVVHPTPPTQDGDPVGHRQYMSQIPMHVTSSNAKNYLDQCIVQHASCTWTIDFETKTVGTAATVACKGDCFTVSGYMISTDNLGKKRVYLTATVHVHPSKSPSSSPQP